MAKAVYILCGLTSLICLVLLTRAYLRSRVRLLFWSAVCFAAFTVTNVLLYLDLAVVSVDLQPTRSAVTLVGMAALLYGLTFSEA